jgi:hypothetical protein
MRKAVLERMNAHYIYVIFAGDSVYIGRTRNIITRMRQHGMIWNDWAILETVTDLVNVREYEAKWVKHFEDLGCDVLNKDKNCQKGGMLGISEEAKRKLSEARRGVPLSAEHCRKLSEAHRGEKQSEEQIRKRVASLIGHEVSQETREKIRASNTGKKPSEETRRKISQSGLRRFSTQEARDEHAKRLAGTNRGGRHPGTKNPPSWFAKMVGRKHSPEHCQAISDGNRLAYAEGRRKRGASC